MTSKRGIPNRRQARLTVRALTIADQELAYSRPCGRIKGIVAAVSQTIEHHYGVGHRREDPAQSVLTVHTFGHELDRFVDRTTPRSRREKWLGRAEHPDEDRKT